MTADCPVCGAADHAVLYDLPNGVIRRCAECRTVSRENLVAGAASEELYEDDSYLDTPYFDALKVGAPRSGEPWNVYRRVLDHLGSSIPGGRLLDVGCSYGAFLELARERGFEVAGVELSKKASRYARRERDLEIFTGTLEEASFEDGAFDVVTLWDLIEHLDRPVDTLREVHRVLAPGGCLVIFTINQRSLINRLGDGLYRATLGRLEKVMVLLYDIHHNVFFDPDTLAAALDRAGFTEPPEIHWMGARIERWQNVEIPSVLAFGTKVLDLASRFVGRPYRMIVYGRRPVG